MALLWHDRGVPASPPSDDDRHDEWSHEPGMSAPRRGGSYGQETEDYGRLTDFPEPRYRPSRFEPLGRRPGGPPGPPPSALLPPPEARPDLDAAPEKPPPRVSRLLSLTIAGFAGLLMIGLVVGAETTRVSYAVVIFGVQVVFVAAWTIASRPPAPRVVAAVGLATAVAADVAAAWVRPASLAPLAYVTAAAFAAGVIGQLSRQAGRVRVTESLGSTLVVVLGVVSFATLVVLTRHPLGTQAIVACLIAAGTSLVVARLTDIVAPLPRLAPQVPRGGAGVVIGTMLGTAAAAVAGNQLVGLHTKETAIAGLITAVVAGVVDLSVGYAEASRHLAGETSAMWLARNLQGPLGGFALAAPAVYATSALLLVPAL
jgi:hypothetical protein